MTDETPGITVLENGPYLVRGGVPVLDAAGSRLEAKEPYSLCRCGGSQSKPFCDGTHRTNGLAGEEVAPRGPVLARQVAYRAAGITVYDDRTTCAHAGYCTDDLASVFRFRHDPPVDPSAAAAGEIAAVVRRCPSGALAYALGDSPEPVEEARPFAILASKDGPYYVTGGLPLASADGTPYAPTMRFTLCRCGRSKRKPFCDGAHWDIEFRAG